MEELTLGIYVPFIQLVTKETDDSEYFKKTNGQQPIARPPTIQMNNIWYTFRRPTITR